MSYVRNLVVAIPLALLSLQSVAFAQDDISRALDSLQIKAADVRKNLEEPSSEGEKSKKEEGDNQEDKKKQGEVKENGDNSAGTEDQDSGQDSNLVGDKKESAIRGIGAIEQKIEEIKTLTEAKKAEELLVAGVAVGAAVGFEYYWETDEIEQTADVMAMPYVAILPWYWRGNRPSQKVFCANTYLGARVDGAQAAADAKTSRPFVRRAHCRMGDARRCFAG